MDNQQTDGLWWADVNDESEEELVPEELVDILAPGGGHVYSVSTQIGEISVATQGDFSYYMNEIYAEFTDAVPGLAGEALWAEIARDMMATSDAELMDAAAFELHMMMADHAITGLDALSVDPPQETVETMEAIDQQIITNTLQKALEDLTLDVFDHTPDKTGFDTPSEGGDAHEHTGMLHTAATPPLCPIPTSPNPMLLRFCSNSGQHTNICEGREDWSQVLKNHDDAFPSERLDTYYDEHTLSSSRSNTRPRGRPAVLVVYEDDTCVNVGSHGYNLSSAIDLRLDLSRSSIAVDELVTAPGGESLTCPTPSHFLHQLVSAITGMALSRYEPEIEEDNIDLSVQTPKGSVVDRINIDFTTSAGIWNKKLGPDAENPKYRVQAAVSKYDLASIYMHAFSGDLKLLIHHAVANCLNCEYPAQYRLSEDKVTSDLAIQSQIYSCLSSMSNKKLQALSESCYEACLLEGLGTLSSLDIHSQGKPWIEKKQEFTEKLEKLKPRSNIAIPPIPIGEITPLPKDDFSIRIRGHDFVAGPYSVQGRTRGPVYSMDGTAAFLKDFPATGIVSYQDACELAAILDETPLSVSGMSHLGPAPGYEGPDAACSTAADSWYKQSAGAQLAEIRSDIVRAVYKLPMPKPNVWSQVYIYKGKVSAWYRCRDPPNSADGYRIDWFAVSSFPVLGSFQTVTNQGDIVHLWPRQRLRSQEMAVIHSGPRRLKAVLFSMLEKAVASQAKLSDIGLAWERLCTTLNSSTYASGRNFLTCRFLSTTISTPSSPFHKMADKLVDPVTYADVAYHQRLKKVFHEWTSRNLYTSRSAILGLPKAYSQLESYWVLWVPSLFADTQKNMTDCIMSLYDEAKFLEMTRAAREEDLQRQLDILNAHEVTLQMLRESIRSTCGLETEGKMGWSWIGSLGSAHALNLRASAAGFDRRYGRGVNARTIVEHLTVRHSARVDELRHLQKGTVAEMILDSGTDNFLSTTTATYRFLYLSRPVFFNHPKGGEHKPREISITDPDSRICLSDAELICGMYGKTTGVEFLKDPAKNAKFYRTASRLMTKGGGIQSSDATRYGPSMSNFAIAIMLLLLGTWSTHLKWASSVYARLAYRWMLLPTSVYPYLDKLAGHDDTRQRAGETSRWMKQMDTMAYEDSSPLVGYCTSHHMGQGMSHHSSSLLHAGGIIMTTDAVNRCTITVKGVEAAFEAHIMVTSDDSTILVETKTANEGDVMNRGMRQIAARIFLQMVREVRTVTLRIVSICPNLVKEIISGVKGEFNSQDTGIGHLCPMLGFRELVALIVVPSAPSLVGDYLNSFACSRDVALAGQGVSTGCYMQALLIDSVEERWGITNDELSILQSLNVLPKQLISGCSGSEILGSPSALLDPDMRAIMLRESIDSNAESEDLDPNTRDSVFAPLMHIKVAMSRQHRTAISCIKRKAMEFAKRGQVHQENLLLQSLRSTISSARSRNLGRIAFRVRNRIIRPREYRGEKFDENTMMECTMNWLAHLDRLLSSRKASASDVRLANGVAGYVKVLSRQRTTFPRPPRLRRFHPNRAKKPKYRENNYGITPFGRHAVQRAGVSVISKIGKAEREAIQAHLAYVRHRKFSEHVEYGGGLVISWRAMTSGVMVAIDITNDMAGQMREHVRLGDFREPALEMLRDLVDCYPDLPVLALHSYDGIRGLWHAVHCGASYTVIADYDLQEHHSNAIYHRLETGQYVMLALQGFDDVAKWRDTVPQNDEVRFYQHSDYNDPMPGLVRSVEDQNIVGGAVQGATYATELQYNGVNTLVYISPEVTSTPRQNPTLLAHLPHLRAKVVASMSAGGYWHTSLRGVAFRAYLRKCFRNETIWTGGVIGWRQSRTSAPTYYSTSAEAVGVRALIVLGGYNDVDQVSRYNPDIHSEGYKVVGQSNTETYDQAFRVSDSYRDVILNANFGQRYHRYNGASTFLDFRNPEPRPPTVTMNPSDALAQLASMLAGGALPAVW